MSFWKEISKPFKSVAKGVTNTVKNIFSKNGVANIVSGIGNFFSGNTNGLVQNLQNLFSSNPTGYSNGTAYGGISNNSWSPSDLLSQLGNLGSTGLELYFNNKYAKEAEELARQSQARQYQYGIASMKWQNRFNVDQQARQYQYQAALQSNNQQWQEQLSNTAHQRAVDDLRAAGLNPLISATGGASTPSGGVGTVGMGGTSGANVSMTDEAQQHMAQIGNALKAKELHLQGVQLAQSIKQMQAQTMLAQQQAESQISQRQLWMSERSLNEAKEGAQLIQNKHLSDKMMAEIGELQAKIGLFKGQANATQSLMEMQKAQAQYYMANALQVGMSNNYWLKHPDLYGAKEFAQGFEPIIRPSITAAGNLTGGWLRGLQGMSGSGKSKGGKK